MHKFADCVNIKSKINANELDEVQEHLIRALTNELRNSQENAERESHRGNVRFEQYCEDMETSPEIMREFMLNELEPYGMSRNCSFSPYYA